MNEFNENFESRRRGHQHQHRGPEGHGQGRGRGPRPFPGDQNGPEGFGPQGPLGAHHHGPDDAFMFGGGRGRGRGPWGEGGPGRRGGGRGPGRGRKGDVRNAILALLKNQELNGYGMISAISEKTDGLWSPSAGSIYPALGLLEDEGLIEPAEASGKKVYRLTEAGRTHVDEHADALANPWEKVAQPHQGFLDVRSDMHQLGMAVQQVVVAGDQEQLQKVKAILESARKDVYRLLAE